MVKISKEDIGKVIDACIDASVKLHSIEVIIKGLQCSIEDLSTKLYFYYEDEEEK